MPSKNIYTYKCSWHIKKSKVCSGPVGPVIVIYSTGLTPEQSDPCTMCPHNMRLYGGWQILYLCHRDCASEHNKVPLNSPQDPLGLSYWEVPGYCCSHSDSNHGFWPWGTPVSCIIGRSHGSHICMHINFYPSNTLIQKHDIYIKKRHKNYICQKKKKLYRWRLTHLPSLLAGRHGYLWIS
jgi:hypothetical protein